MNEKAAEAFLPSSKGHIMSFPNDIQQLTVKDSTIFIGKDHPRRSTLPCFRCLNIFTIVLVIAIVGIVLLPTLYHLTKLVSVSGTADSGYYVSINRDILNSLTEAVNNVERTIESLPNVFGKNKLSSTTNEPDVTILYSFRDPAYSLNDFFEFNSVYIARGYQTTLSFLIQNNQSTTYLDDVSVNNTYGSQLMVNGDFGSGTYGWQGLSSYSTYCSSYRYSYSNNCATSSYTSNGTLSQTFSTSPGTVLHISFKLHWGGSGPGIFTKVTIYP